VGPRLLLSAGRRRARDRFDDTGSWRSEFWSGSPANTFQSALRRTIGFAARWGQRGGWLEDCSAADGDPLGRARQLETAPASISVGKGSSPIQAGKSRQVVGSL